MQEMIKSIYEAVSEIVSPFKTLYPYQDIEADVDTGVVTFAPNKITSLTLAGERLLRGLPNSRLNKEETEFAQAGEHLLDSSPAAQNDRSGESAAQNDAFSLLIDAVTQVCFQVDVYKSISWNDKDISAFDMAERLQIYLKSSNARDKFFNNYKYELMPVWSDIIFEADFNTYKKWVQVAQFEIFIAKMSSITLSDTPLKNIQIEVNEINTLKNNPAYNSMMNKFLKTN